MTANGTLITVVMPVFNGEKYLSRAIDSILSQTYKEFEFLIIDDGSTDHTCEIIRRFAALDSRIRWLSRENRGLVATLNEALELARGVWIVRLDHDDVALPERIEKQVNFVQNTPECVVLGGAFEYIDEKDRILTKIYPPEDDASIQNLMLSGHNALCDTTVMFRRDLALRLGGYRPEMYLAEDFDLWLRMGEHGKLMNLSDVLSQYRLHTTSVSGEYHERQIKMLQAACEDAWRRRGVQGKFEATVPWRPSKSRDSQLKFFVMYGWWAFNSGNWLTAAVYGIRAIWTNPFQMEGYRLLVCSLLKRCPSNR